MGVQNDQLTVLASGTKTGLIAQTVGCTFQRVGNTPGLFSLVLSEDVDPTEMVCNVTSFTANASGSITFTGANTATIALSADGVTFESDFSFTIVRQANASLGLVNASGPPIPPPGGTTDLQGAYNNSTGIPVPIVESVGKDGIRITGFLGMTVPVLELVNPSAQSNLRITRTLTGNGIDVFMPVVVGGSAINITLPVGGSSSGMTVAVDGTGNAHTIAISGAGNGIRVTTPAGSSGNGFSMTSAAGSSANGINITNSAGATGRGFFFTGAAGSTGRGINVTQAGTGIVMETSQTGSGRTFLLTHTGTGVVIDIVHSAGGNDTVLITKAPAAATAGSGLRLNFGVNTTGPTILTVTAGSGGNIFATNSGAGRTMEFNHTGAGEVWRITGPAALVFSVMTSGGQLQMQAGSAAAPSYAFTLSTGSGFFRSAADVIGVSLAGTQRFQYTGVGTGEFIPPADNQGSVGTAARRFALVRATTITSGDLAFEDEACPKCGTGFEEDDEIVLKVYKVKADDEGRRVSYSVPMHSRCGGNHV